MGRQSAACRFIHRQTRAKPYLALECMGIGGLKSAAFDDQRIGRNSRLHAIPFGRPQTSSNRAPTIEGQAPIRLTIIGTARFGTVHNGPVCALFRKINTARNDTLPTLRNESVVSDLRVRHDSAQTT